MKRSILLISMLICLSVGAADGQSLIFHCRMGDKLLEYEGRLVHEAK